MVIELRGVEFVNKGAELMFHAIVHKVKERFPDAIIAMEPTPRVSLKNLAVHKIHVKRNRKALLLPRFMRRIMRIVHEKEIKVVLDGSGFAFGDQWGVKHAEKKLGSKIVNWHRQGKKIILLPQAFGSFSDPELRTTMEKIVANADLIFAREQQSYNYLTHIPNKNNIHLAPDFTNLLPGTIPSDFTIENRQVAIIPNYQMIKKKGEAGKYYHDYLYTAIKKVQSLGLKPYFLIHEGEKDIRIAQEVNALLQQPLELITTNNALEIKGIISTAQFIICSRFHGVVSALSQGVPSISTSWSHKYEMLHQEYDYEEGLIQDITNNGEIESKIEALANPAIRRQISENLSSRSKLLKQKSAEMWETVFTILN